MNNFMCKHNKSIFETHLQGKTENTVDMNKV